MELELPVDRCFALVFALELGDDFGVELDFGNDFGLELDLEDDFGLGLNFGVDVGFSLWDGLATFAPVKFEDGVVAECFCTLDVLICPF